MRVFVAIVVLALGAVNAGAEPPNRGPSLAASLPYEWSGFYVGANGGWAEPIEPSGRLRGMFGGGQAGYNFQDRWLILGIEGDIQATAQRFSSSGLSMPSASTLFTQTSGLPIMGTVRARAGVALDRWLLYATGGIFFMKGTYAFTATPVALGGVSGAQSDSFYKAGWTVGGGVESQIAGPWSAKLEYLYAGIDPFTKIYPLTTSIGTPTTLTVNFPHFQEHLVRFGVNYRLSPG